MSKKTVADIEVRSKRILTRVDFNVPQDEQGQITDDRRIRMALPTIENILNRGGRLILMSHLGRPTGEIREADMKWTLAPVAQQLGELLGKPVAFAEDCVGQEAKQIVTGLKDGGCCLLENLRFHIAEQIKDKDASTDSELREKKDTFSRQIAALGDVYVNDAFGTCHRDNASMLTVPQLMKGKPRVIGFLLEKELRYLGDALNTPKRPFVAIIGGKKVSDKIGVIEALLDICDQVLIGGAMAFTFLLALEQKIGKSFIEPEKVGEAIRLYDLGGERLWLPEDIVAAKELRENIETHVYAENIPEEMSGYDIGPNTIKVFSEIISTAKTIIWNGPMGVFEIKPFDAGTIALAKAVAGATASGAISVIGGGDSASAIEQAGLSDQVTHVSTGGGASLKLLEGKSFEAISVLEDK